ncbi:hypothetical protein SUGI_0884420 [Cryptomeria japonica]|nr:hypothetical protein SUGI_0884420 [Cryptomeria japonica]
MAKKQLDVLTALGAAKAQWYHFTAILIAGMDFFTDESIIPRTRRSAYPRLYCLESRVWPCAELWRGSSCSDRWATNWDGRRFWLGFGIGGDYPLSATIMSEYANKKTRGAFLAAVFAMQGFGILAVERARIPIVFCPVLETPWPKPSPDNVHLVRPPGHRLLQLQPVSEGYPVTCHGMSAAMGKAGAIVGAFGAGYLTKDNKHLKTALLILAFTNALGFVFTFLVPETNGRSLEEISGENDDVDDKDTDPKIPHTFSV